jgi:hypothetical protein
MGNTPPCFHGIDTGHSTFSAVNRGQQPIVRVGATRRTTGYRLAYWRW